MTSARRPAGAPDGERRPAGLPDQPREHSGKQDREPLEKDLDELLAETQRERDEYLEIARRARADFENYRKRAAREAQEAERRGKAALARELVPALDDLERARLAAGIGPEAGTGGHEVEEAPSE